MSFPHEDPEFSELIRIVGEHHELNEALIEKDYWVTHALWALHQTGLDIWFKGGTSLSKGYGLIERFSEDLDLKIEPGREASVPTVTNWKSTNKGRVQERRAFFQALTNAIPIPHSTVSLDEDSIDRDVRDAIYAVAYPGSYLEQMPPPMRPFVQMEVGSARVTPFVARSLTSFIHEWLEDQPRLQDSPRLSECPRRTGSRSEPTDSMAMTRKKKSPATRKSRKKAAPAKRGDDAIAGYDEFLRQLKERIRDARLRASLSVNSELVLLYWQIGRNILDRQAKEGWGAKVIDRLSADLKRAFPEMTGFSPRNLKFMRKFAEAWPEHKFVKQVASQIPWFHHYELLNKVRGPEEREWYIRKTIEHGWSRSVLVHWIESGLYQREGSAQTNFERSLPAPQSDLAQQLIKDPYKFDFLGIGQEAHEREIEGALIRHIRDFLLELGIGFAFIGNQYRLEVGSEEFFARIMARWSRCPRWLAPPLHAQAA